MSRLRLFLFALVVSISAQCEPVLAADKVQALIDNIPGAEAAISASSNSGGLTTLMGGGLMALGTKLMGLGLGMSEIQNVARELFRFGRDKIGADQMGEIIAGTPGLSQFA